MKTFSHLLLSLGILAALATIPTKAFAEDSSNVITVTAQGTAEASPDMAILELGVETNGQTAQEALNNNKAMILKIMKKLTENNIDQRDIQTSNLSLFQNFNDKDKTTTYQVSNRISITIRQLQMLGKIFDQAIALGANVSQGISFTNVDKTPYQNAARTQAVQKAIANANVLAKAAQVKLGKILSIEENTAPQGIMPRGAMMLAAGNNANTPISGGTLNYNIGVKVTFAIAPNA